MDYSCRIFYISEILRVILDNLADDKRSMVSLAYSSKAVSGEALDYLWADMDSFFPFVRLLPTPVQEIWDMTFDIALLPLMECPPPEEWTLFDTYAYRVRRIRPRGEYLDRALYQRLVSIRSGTDLFPRLSSLRCYLCNPLTPTPGVKIFPSSLRSLSLYPEYALTLDGRAEISMRQAACDAPFLEELYIIGVYRLHSETGLRPLDFKKLHTVHIIAHILPADLQSFLHLLSTSPIQNLGITLLCGPEVSFQLDGPGVSPSMLPRVEKIFICDGPSRATDIVSRICSPCLNSVTIKLRNRFASVSEYGRFFTLLAQRHPPVHSLEVGMGPMYVNSRHEYARGFLAALEPLVDAGLARLKVEMSLCGAWQTGEDVKKKLRPEAWPSLASFEFVLRESSTLDALPMASLG
ncbi:hypothetical protein HD554DRAFT_2172579 [Boletus coccyginus]|nr:hypothetical protein HD554DRAFT_2172579 [Boletus coccyginus]